MDHVSRPGQTFLSLQSQKRENVGMEVARAPASEPVAAAHIWLDSPVDHGLQFRRPSFHVWPTSRGQDIWRNVFCHVWPIVVYGWWQVFKVLLWPNG